MNGMAMRGLAGLAVAGALLAAAGTARAGSITIQPTKLTRVYHVQNDSQDPRRVGSYAGLAGFWYQLAIPVGSKITALRYVHECPSPTSPCKTSAAIWRVKASDATPLRQLYAASYALYDMGLWVDGAAFPGADLVVRSGWRYFVTAACQDEDTMVGEIVVTWK